MNSDRRMVLLVSAILALPSLIGVAQAQGAKMAGKQAKACCGNGACCGGAMAANGSGAGMMQGPGMGMGPQGRMMQDPTRRQDMAVFHFLVTNHKKVQRSVKQLENGVETTTESNDTKIVAKIREHVPAMYARLKEGRGVHLVDPLFVALFENGKKIDAQVSNTEKGVKVVETSNDPYVVKLIKAHAKSIDELVAKGMAGMHPHDVPKR